MQSLDRIRRAHAAPLAWRQASKGEQALSGLLQAVGDSTMLEPPFADKSLAAGLDLLRCRRVDHVVVIRGDLVMQALGGMREKVSVLLDWGAVGRALLPRPRRWPCRAPARHRR